MRLVEATAGHQVENRREDKSKAIDTYYPNKFEDLIDRWDKARAENSQEEVDRRRQVVRLVTHVFVGKSIVSALRLLWVIQRSASIIIGCFEPFNKLRGPP